MAAAQSSKTPSGEKASEGGSKERRRGADAMLRHRQVFGLQKYFPWGVTLYNMEIGGYEDKIKALDVLNAYAELAGARGPVRDRMALVAEELIINGMYHAPVDASGKPLYRHMA